VKRNYSPWKRIASGVALIIFFLFISGDLVGIYYAINQVLSSIS